MSDIRWNVMDPNDENSAVIMPREDFERARQLEAENERLREAILLHMRRTTARAVRKRRAIFWLAYGPNDDIDRELYAALGEEER